MAADLSLQHSRTYTPLCALAPWRQALTIVLLAVTFQSRTIAARAQEPVFGPPVHDAAKIVGSDQCAKCHDKEVQQWMRTPHFATFDTLHRKPTTRAADSGRTLSDCLLAELEVSPHGPRVERCWRSSTVESA